MQLTSEQSDFLKYADSRFSSIQDEMEKQALLGELAQGVRKGWQAARGAMRAGGSMRGVFREGLAAGKKEFQNARQYTRFADKLSDMKLGGPMSAARLNKILDYGAGKISRDAVVRDLMVQSGKSKDIISRYLKPFDTAKSQGHFDKYFKRTAPSSAGAKAPSSPTYAQTVKTPAPKPAVGSSASKGEAASAAEAATAAKAPSGAGAKELKTGVNDKKVYASTEEALKDNPKIKELFETYNVPKNEWATAMRRLGIETGDMRPAWMSMDNPAMPAAVGFAAGGVPGYLLGKNNGAEDAHLEDSQRMAAILTTLRDQMKEQNSSIWNRLGNVFTGSLTGGFS